MEGGRAMSSSFQKIDTSDFCPRSSNGPPSGLRSEGNPDVWLHRRRACYRKVVRL